jgi:threonine/homoserine/homoserine lactone efflux protein
MTSVALRLLRALAYTDACGERASFVRGRSICQGRAAGVISLFGVIAGFVVHTLAAALALRLLSRERREMRSCRVDRAPAAVTVILKSKAF